MQDHNDRYNGQQSIEVAELKPTDAPLRKMGRPRKPDALTEAERARRYRARKKARMAELLDTSKPIRSKVIDLSALPPWKCA